MGDSLTDPKSHGGAYLAYVAARCPESSFENFAKGGTLVNQMRKRLELEVLPEPPEARARYTHLVVFGGVNDVLSDETAKRTPRLVQRDLRAMYDRAHSRGIRVVAVTMSPWGGFARQWNPNRHAATLAINGWIRERARDGTVDHVVDAWTLLSCGVETHLCAEYVPPMRDGLHFGPPGHEQLGRALHQAAFADCR
ncbi:MAG: hypothetical protein IT376_20365 [Polyangiaceae bacterium]|nr:hypothetical protein [Polyangiaceae bacterium]